MASKPLTELAPIGMALRAFNLSLRNDPSTSGTIDNLLERAETLAPEETFILFVHSTSLLLRAFEQWDASIATLMPPVVELMRKNLSLMASSVSARFLLSVCLLYMHRRDEAFTLLQQVMAEQSDSRDSLLTLVEGLYALTGGDAATAAQIYMDFFSGVPPMPLTMAADHNLIVSCFLAEQYDVALDRARTMLITNPNRTAVLLPALAAACVTGQHELADEYAERLSLLQPDLTTARIEAHYTYLQPQHMKRLTDALKEGGFLQDDQTPLRPLSAESASRRLAGLPRQDMKTAETHPTMNRT